MAKLFDHDGYFAELRELSDEDFCKRLEGVYHSAVGTYNAGPLAVEAARRIRMAHLPTASVADRQAADER